MHNFIPKQYKKEAITVRIDTETLEKIEHFAGKYDISRSAFINQCIEFAIENMSPPENKENSDEKNDKT